MIRAICDSSGAALAHNLENRFLEDTSVHFSYLPVLRAPFALNRHELPTRISSPSGKSLTPTSPSSSKLKRSTLD
jgi:hypothetical protein